jgi:hypothetical protein
MTTLFNPSTPFWVWCFRNRRARSTAPAVVTTCFRLLREGKWQTMVHPPCHRVDSKKPDGVRQALQIPEAESRPVMGRIAVSRLEG